MIVAGKVGRIRPISDKADFKVKPVDRFRLVPDFKDLKSALESGRIGLNSNFDGTDYT